MTIANALKIPGWMEPSALAWLATEAEKHSRIVEIGSYLGRSTRALAENTPGLVFSVDLWETTPELAKAYLTNTASGGVFNHYRANLRDLIGSKVIPIRAESLAAATSFPCPVFDMIFIDGAHDFYSVLADIGIWAKTLKSGGLLCGHDYDWESVRVAVNALVPQAKVVPDTTLWYATLDQEVVIPDSEHLPSTNRS